jgi:hypothetical protein
MSNTTTVKFFVVNTFQGKVESTHRSFDAADKADDKLRRAVKRANPGCYIPTVIVEAASKEAALQLAGK